MACHTGSPVEVMTHGLTVVKDQHIEDRASS
jgi:hypothetical protein